MMDIVVIGLGSMGKRRIRILRGLYGNVRICGVDAKDNRRAECEARFEILVYANLAECLQENSLDVAFICTPPLTHAGIIQECLVHDLHVFSEINLVTAGYTENLALAKQKKRRLFLSSTPLYRSEIKYILHKVKETEGVVNYLFHVGQYLPDWHPWDVLQEFFISKKETNGCREILAIELPWILQTFGKVKRMEVMRHKASSLPIAYDDSYFVVLEHESGHHGTLIVDVVSREPVSHLEVFGEKLFLSWDGTPDTLREKDIDHQQMRVVHSYAEEKIWHEAGYSLNIVENAYTAEVQNFFAVLEGKEQPMHSFDADVEVLNLIDKIEGLNI